ncbi:glycosyltransferase family 4 protein [Escherichia marmotae]|nr:glycosyltransferase family 4 protein [Escherichia marmotae]
MAVTSGIKTPSSRFRIRQHIEQLRKYNLYVDEIIPPIDKNKSVPFLSKFSPKYYIPLYIPWQIIKILQRLPILFKQTGYKYIWLNRELLTGIPTLEVFFCKKIILDVDDAIWKNPPLGEVTARFLAKKSYKIICGNNYLAEWFRRYNKNVYVIPTAVDVHKFIPRCNKRKDIILGWIGTHGNLKYLEKIYPALLKIFNNNSNVYLNIVSDKRPEFYIDNSRVNYIQWSEEDEVQNFQSIDIGLMPLDDNEWTRGKCSYKLLQHMACGSLVVGSPVGMNKEILLEDNGAYPANSENEWVNTLSYLISNFEEIYCIQSKKARRFIECEYSADAIREKLARVMIDD